MTFYTLQVLQPSIKTEANAERLQNTQSGTQWDGMRHFGILEHGVFYNK